MGSISNGLIETSKGLTGYRLALFLLSEVVFILSASIRVLLHILNEKMLRQQKGSICKFKGVKE